MSTFHRFKVLCGEYRSRNGAIYKPGDEITCSERLDKMFANAFELMHEIADVDEVDMPEFAYPWKLRRRGSRYEVLNTTTKQVLNDKLLTKAEAQKAFIHYDWSEMWDPPPIWQDQTVFVIGGGPSIKTMDLSPIHDARVLGVNDAYVLGDWVDVCFFGDWHWLCEHKKDFSLWPGLKVGSHDNCRGISGIHWMKRIAGGIGSGGTLGWYLNSGAAAILLSILLGAETVVLLGFDMKLGEKKESNWHVNNLDNNTARTYEGFKYEMLVMSLMLKKQRPDVTILNANPNSALDLWPRMTLEEVLNG